MTLRWVVDVDARGGYRVAEEGGTFASDVLPLAKAERILKRLRERDAARAHAARVQAGHRLAARNRRASEPAEGDE